MHQRARVFIHTDLGSGRDRREGTGHSRQPPPAVKQGGRGVSGNTSLDHPVPGFAIMGRACLIERTLFRAQPISIKCRFINNMRRERRMGGREKTPLRLRVFSRRTSTFTGRPGAGGYNGSAATQPPAEDAPVERMVPVLVSVQDEAQPRRPLFRGDMICMVFESGFECRLSAS
jgi:hypothetical protein